jgi:Mg-chelatase subunit ChlD
MKLTLPVILYEFILYGKRVTFELLLVLRRKYPAMIRSFFLTLSFLLLVFSLTAQVVNGKIKTTGDANLHVIRLFADSFPQVALTFQAETSEGKPVWNLQKEDVRVEENDRVGKITSFRLLSSEQHLQTVVVIDHSGSMSSDWRFNDWYLKINWDTIPNDTIREYWTQHCEGSDPETIKCTGPLVKRDTFYLKKHVPEYIGYRTPLWYAQQGAKTFFASMKSKQDSSALIGFSDVPDVYVPVAESNYKTEDQIDAMTADGATAFYDALDQSLNHLVRHKGMRAIVAMTDGKDNSSHISLRKLIHKAKKMRCPVYVIGLGDVDRAALEQLTKETGGELFLTTDATQLGDFFERISVKLHAVYELVYESPFLKSDEATHELQLRFDVDSMFLNSQLIDLPLPESVITHLQKREAQQNNFQQAFPLKQDSIATNSTVASSATVAPATPGTDEFPYGALGITLAVAGAGVLIYRKTQRKQKQSALQLISVFPNPTNGPVTLNYQSDSPVVLRAIVMNEAGEQVYEQPLPAGQNTSSIDLSGMTDGVYLLRIESESMISRTEKIILQR